MRPSRSMRLAPLTVVMVWLACGIFVGVQFEKRDAKQNPGTKVSSWGAVEQQTRFVKHPQDTEFKPVEGLSGPFKVWRGEWYRVIVNAFHHGDLMHLIFNGWALLYLGRILEPRMTRFGFLAFFLGAATVSMVAEALVLNYAIGLSGVICAMVGLLMVWRDRDEEVAEECPFGLILFCGGWLVVAQVLTYIGFMHIANLAHYSGLVYGWLWGQAFLGHRQQSGLFRFLFAVGHFALIPLFWLIVNPFWSGTWYWSQAYAQDISITRKVELLQSAVLSDPQLAGAWKELATIIAVTDEQGNALRIAFEGLKQNRGDEDLSNLVIDLWFIDEAGTPYPLADQLVEQVFGDEAETWRDELHASVDAIQNRKSWSPEQLARMMGMLPDQTQRLTAERNLGIEPAPESFEVDPDAPDSALGGERL